MRILLTGANGFIGRHLLATLRSAKHQVYALVRSRSQPIIPEINYLDCCALVSDEDWQRCLQGIDCIVHLSAHLHCGKSLTKIHDFQTINVQDSVRLAQLAKHQSIKRFIYISSIKVHGECSGQQAFSADSPTAPQDQYATDKLKVEQALTDVFCGPAANKLTIIRPPLVYGPASRGHVPILIKAIALSLPLPLAAINNRRSFVSVFNLCDLIRVCCAHPLAGGEVFLVSDDEDLSTPDLVRVIAAAMHKRARLFPCRQSILSVLARLPRLAYYLPKLLDNLYINMEKTKRLLQWTPPYTLRDSIRTTVLDVLQADKR